MLSSRNKNLMERSAMGAGVKNLSRLLELAARELLPLEARVAELGAQQLFCDGHTDYLRAFIDWFAHRRSAVRSAGDYSESELSRMASGGFTSSLLMACGMHYQALDLFSAPHTIVFDLNRDQLRAEWCQSFDLVTNFGTTEHVLGQLQSMKIMHELAKPGGLIYHDLPMAGYHSHGYFSYNPLLFEELAAANKYEVVLLAISKDTRMTLVSPTLGKLGYPDQGYHDMGVECIFRKTLSQEFRSPLEVSTSLSVDDRFTLREPPASMPQRRATGYIPSTIASAPGRVLALELLNRVRRRIRKLVAYPSSS